MHHAMMRLRLLNGDAVTRDGTLDYIYRRLVTQVTFYQVMAHGRRIYCALVHTSTRKWYSGSQRCRRR